MTDRVWFITGSSPCGPDYEATVGAMAGRMRTVTGSEPIDPVKVARVFLDLAKLPDPPLHLVLGNRRYISRQCPSGRTSSAAHAATPCR